MGPSLDRHWLAAHVQGEPNISLAPAPDAMLEAVFTQL